MWQQHGRCRHSVRRCRPLPPHRRMAQDAKHLQRPRHCPCHPRKVPRHSPRLPPRSATHLARRRRRRRRRRSPPDQCPAMPAQQAGWSKKGLANALVAQLPAARCHPPHPTLPTRGGWRLLRRGRRGLRLSWCAAFVIPWDALPEAPVRVCMCLHVHACTCMDHGCGDMCGHAYVSVCICMCRYAYRGGCAYPCTYTYACGVSSIPIDMERGRSRSVRLEGREGDRERGEGGERER